MYTLTYRKFEKRWTDLFQIYPNRVHFNAPQFCPSMSVLGFSVSCKSSSIVLSRYSDILVNSMTIWSVPKLPKIWFKQYLRSIFSLSNKFEPGTLTSLQVSFDRYQRQHGNNYNIIQDVCVIDKAWRQDGWILAKFFFYVFIDRDGVEVHKHAKKK